MKLEEYIKIKNMTTSELNRLSLGLPPSPFGYVGSDGSEIPEAEDPTPAFTRGLSPKKAMGIGLNLPPKPKDPAAFWERREVWRSPFAIPLAIGFAIFFIGWGLWWGLWWVVKWPVLATIRPFSNSKKLCKMGFHKFREVSSSKWDGTKYKCFVCEETKTVKNDD